MFPPNVQQIFQSFFVALIIISFSLSSAAQGNYKEKSDPEATKILKKLKTVYSKYDAIEISTTLKAQLSSNFLK